MTLERSTRRLGEGGLEIRGRCQSLYRPWSSLSGALGVVNPDFSTPSLDIPIATTAVIHLKRERKLSFYASFSVCLILQVFAKG